MPVKIASLDSIPVQNMPGRDVQWLVTPNNLGTANVAVVWLRAPVGAVVRPMHGHRDTEEVFVVLEGEGEALVDGETSPFKKGDAVFFPANSKHMIRNTGSGTLVGLGIFSPPTTAASYLIFENEGW
jgi:mannose-6-phosphate isomerase-like protein (cupin superfamily)